METTLILEKISPFLFLLVPLIILDVVLKGMALWKSAKLGQKNWFICLFIFNTIGILPALYLFYFSKKRETKAAKN